MALSTKFSFTDSFEFIVKGCQEKLMDVLYSQWLEQSQFCDLKLHTSNGIIPVHTCVLMAFSPRIAEMIVVKGKKSRKGKSLDRCVVDIQFDFYTVTCIVKSIYSGVFNTTSVSNLQELYAALTWFGVEELEDVAKSLEQYIEDTAVSVSGSPNKRKKVCKKKHSLNEGGVNKKKEICIGDDPHENLNTCKEDDILVTVNRSVVCSTAEESGSDIRKNKNEQESGSNKRKKKNEQESGSNKRKKKNEQESGSDIRKKRNGREEHKKAKQKGRKVSCSKKSGAARMRSLSSVKGLLDTQTEMDATNILVNIARDNLDLNSVKTEDLDENEDVNIQDLESGPSGTLQNGLFDNPDVVRLILTPGDSMKCDKCKLIFTNVDEYQHHINNHPTFPCDQCDTVFYSFSLFVRHKRQAHLKANHLKCLSCEFETSDPAQFSEHCLTVHDVTKPFQCRFEGCNYRTKVYRYLSNHFEIHEGLRAFECEKCGKTFARPSYFCSHQKTCYKARAFLCDLCGQSFNHAHSMKNHRRTMHLGDKPFKCTMCDKQFGDHSNLSRHMRVHNNVFPYSCPVCSQPFRHSNSLKYHMMSKHSGFGAQWDLADCANKRKADTGHNNDSNTNTSSPNNSNKSHHSNDKSNSGNTGNKNVDVNTGTTATTTAPNANTASITTAINDSKSNSSQADTRQKKNIADHVVSGSDKSNYNGNINIIIENVNGVEDILHPLPSSGHFSSCGDNNESVTTTFEQGFLKFLGK